jgi:hypothetical protein
LIRYKMGTFKWCFLLKEQFIIKKLNKNFKKTLQD